MVQIGTKIKKIREFKNFTQEYMAEVLEVSQSTYSRFEKEDADLSISQIEKIAQTFDMKIEDLLSFDEKYIFNNYGSAHDQSFSINYIGTKERELYEKAIKLLEDKVALLEKLANK